LLSVHWRKVLPVPGADSAAVIVVQTLDAHSSEVITFSEYAVGTSITDQYRDIGILFGAGAFITPMAPTRPVPSSPVRRASRETLPAGSSNPERMIPSW
jgi:hypothetical protein